jgi:hypothetical protein
MNIFVTSECPWECAEYLDPKRRNKMLTETCQMLATVLHWNNAPELPRKADGSTMKVSHPHHPCTKWAGRTRGNYLWLLEHAEALYCTYRAKDGGKAHLHVPENLEIFRRMAYCVSDGQRTAFQNSARNTEKNLDFTHLPVYTAYRQFLKAQGVEHGNELLPA